MAGELVLLTGATGFIGFRTLVSLLEAGYKVRTAVRNVAGFEKIKALPSAAPYQSQLEHIVVPEITVPGAYDNAVKGVKYIIHAASPFAAPDLLAGEFETGYIQPAIKGTVGMLESAAKVEGIERIVITASILSIAGLQIMGTDTLVNEKHRSAVYEPPYPFWLVAYSDSKARALNASEKWMEDNKPAFDLVNIEPTYVIGGDETATNTQELLKGSNGSVMGPILGTPATNANPGITVHVDDVALMHVKSLNPAIPAQDFLASSHAPNGIQWADSFDIIKRAYPKECSQGIFKVDTTPHPETRQLLIDASKAQDVLGIQFKTFEQQVIDVAANYLELLGKE